MSKPTLNIGLIGSGFMGQAHADAFRRARMLYPNLPMAPHLYCLADANDELAAKAAARFGFETSTGDWRKLINDPKVDVMCDMALVTYVNTGSVTSPAAAPRSVSWLESATLRHDGQRWRISFFHSTVVPQS